MLKDWKKSSSYIFYFLSFLAKLLTSKLGTVSVLYNMMNSIILLCGDRRFGGAVALLLNVYRAEDVVVCSAGFKYRSSEEWHSCTELKGYVMFHKTDLILYLNVFLCQAVFDFWREALSKVLLCQETAHLVPVAWAEHLMTETKPYYRCVSLSSLVQLLIHLGRSVFFILLFSLLWLKNIELILWRTVV